MKYIRKKVIISICIFAVCTFATDVKALIWLDGCSSPGSITISMALLIPLPFTTLVITESEPVNLFDSVHLSLRRHDDEKKYNILSITTGQSKTLELPVPYGSFGLQYLTLPDWPPPPMENTEISAYLSVGHNHIISTFKTDIDLNISFEREHMGELLSLLTNRDDLTSYLTSGPFEIQFVLEGSLSGDVRKSNPVCSGSFDYVLTLPQDIFTAETPIEVPQLLEGTLSLFVTFNWNNWSFFNPFAGADVSATLNSNGREITLDNLHWEILPKGTFILWLDWEEEYQESL